MTETSSDVERTFTETKVLRKEFVINICVCVGRGAKLSQDQLLSLVLQVVTKAVVLREAGGKTVQVSPGGK